MKKYQLTEEEYKRILDFKRDLHMHPELSRKELQTTAKIRAFLESLPDFRIFPLETETGTGIAAQIYGEEGKEKSLEIMLRADIDALPHPGHPVSCMPAAMISIRPLCWGRPFCCSVPKMTAFSGILWTWFSSRQRRERPVRVS